jgi:hypothetical protein
LQRCNNPQQRTLFSYSDSKLDYWLRTTEGGPTQVDDYIPPPKKQKYKTQNMNKPPAAKTRRIRVYPSADQKVILF